MRVAHGVWHDDGLHLWVEDPALPSSNTRGRSPRRHPFALPAAELAGAFGHAGDLVAKGGEGELPLALPGTTARPDPSPDLVVDRPARRGAHRLVTWRVPVRTFAPEQAVRLLDALRTEPADVLVAAELAYLTVLAEDAADLAGRGRLLPDLVADADGHRARWRCVLSGPDAERARTLAGAMPPLLRGAGGVEHASADVLGAALDAFADATVRSGLDLPLLAARHGRKPARVPLAERWVTALTGADTRVRVDDTEQREVAELTEALRAWRAAAHRGDGPVRTAFRLTEPELPDASSEAAEPAEREDTPERDEAAAQAPWRIEIALQSIEDPSLLVPAEAVWRGDPEQLGRLVLERPEEALLTGLGQAARLFDELDAELRGAAPSGVTTDATGAYRFLTRTAPTLAAAGFGVQLPSWAGATKLGRKLTTSSASGGQQAAAAQGFGLDELVDFRWDLALDEQTIDAEELARLAALKVPLVRLRGRWVELDDQQLAAAAKFFEHDRAGRMTAAEVLNVALRTDEEEDLPLSSVQADGALGDLLSGEADRRLTPLRTPENFTGSLRPYQERGLAWLSFMSSLGLGTVLADDMGLGKSPMTLSLLAQERLHATPPPTLLICPMSLVGNWQREAARFTPDLRVYVQHGKDRAHGTELDAAVANADLVITTYATATRDHAELAAFTWSRVVCDEAQAIKNAQTKQATAVRALPAGHRLALTGTPMENHLAELWSIMEFTNPGLLGSAAKFRKRFATPIEADGDEQASAHLKRITGPFMLRRVKTDTSIISDLPDKQEMKIWCNLTPEQASLYQATVDDMMQRLDDSEGITYRGLVLATMSKLKQVCNHPSHLLKDGSRLAGRSGKLARLEEIVDEVLADGDKALCFTQYAEFGAMLQPYLAARTGRPVLYLHGGVGKKQRDAMIERFQKDDEPTVFLLSLKAAGTGLNLTAANHVIHVDRWWNPAVEDQATDRAFRIGQHRNVQVRKFICLGTLEERIDAMIDRKKALAERIVGTGEDWLTSLSTSELRDVIELAPEAVSPA